MSLLHLSLLGGFDCRWAGGAAPTFPTHKARALLVFLAVNAGRCHPRDKLAGLLWSDRADAEARANLRKALTRLRQALGRGPGPRSSRRSGPSPPGRAPRDWLVVDQSGVAIDPDVVDVDVARFERLAAAGTPESLEQAATLYRGPFLEGFADCGEPFGEWLMAERRRWAETLRHALQRLLDDYTATGAIDRAIQAALRLLALDPLEEGVHRALMRLYLSQDRLGTALEQYRRCQEVLARELGVSPGPETEKLRAEIRAAVPAGDGEGLRPDGDDLPGRAEIVRVAAEERARRRTELAGRPCIAVLPLTGVEDDVPHRHLGDGLADDLATELGRFPELDVMAPSTARVYRGAAVTPDRVGRELGATYVLEGSVRARAGDLTITARLVEAATGRQVWAERYPCTRAGVLDVQDDLVRHIAGTLVGGLARVRLEAARHTRPEDWQAYDLWLQGWTALKRAERRALGEARALFRQAAAKDPGFAPAWSGLALAQCQEWACFSWTPWVLLEREALDLARKAVDLDDRDHRAHCVLGVTQLYAGDYEGAHRQLSRALALNPSDPDVLAHGAFGLALLGRHDVSVEAGRRALRLHPHHPDWYAGLVGIALFGARLHEEAVRTMAPAPEGFCSVPAFIAASLAHLGQVGEAGRYRDTVYRHYRNRVRRAEVPASTSCVDWLLAVDPFRLPADLEHYAEGLRRAGFE